jgi:plasmid replication initiation protein
MSRQVVQSYIVTTAMYDFNVYEKRVLYNLVRLAQSQIEGVRLSDSLYKIEHALTDAIRIELPLSDFLIDKDDKNHYRVKNALKSLHQKTFTYNDEGSWEYFSIIANPKIRLRSSKVSFIVDSRVWDVLLDFSKGFSRYNLEIAFRLESVYSMRSMKCCQARRNPSPTP